MSKAVFDTNILIDHLCGHAQAEQSWLSYQERCISRITFMEVLAGADTLQEETAARTLLSTFSIIELDAALSEAVVTLRRNHPKKIKLPDAIIYVTARSAGCPLITRNPKDFGSAASDVIEPYVLP